jgi:hypothetical protein
MTDRIVKEPPTFALWCLSLADNEARCMIVWRPLGFEAQFLFNGQLLYSQTLSSLSDAECWANLRKSEMEAQGWHPAVPTARRRAVARTPCFGRKPRRATSHI